MIQTMSYLSVRLTKHLDSIGWGEYGLVQRFKDLEKSERLSEQYVYALCRGEKAPKKETLEKISRVPGIGLEFAQLKAWRYLDEFEKEEFIFLYQEISKEIEEEK